MRTTGMLQTTLSLVKQGNINFADTAKSIKAVATSMASSRHAQNTFSAISMSMQTETQHSRFQVPGNINRNGSLPCLTQAGQSFRNAKARIAREKLNPQSAGKS